MVSIRVGTNVRQLGLAIVAGLGLGFLDVEWLKLHVGFPTCRHNHVVKQSYTGDDEWQLTCKELSSAVEWRHIEENSYIL